jgi:hypothetical protein
MESPDFKPPPDMMQFVLDATKKTGEGRSLEYQVNAVIGTGRAALFTTGITIYHLIYDLATHSEYIGPLRQELKELGDVPMTRANVSKLTKMDSFIRESQRWNKFMLGKCPALLFRPRATLAFLCTLSDNILQWVLSARSCRALHFPTGQSSQPAPTSAPTSGTYISTIPVSKTLTSSTASGTYLPYSHPRKVPATHT